MTDSVLLVIMIAITIVCCLIVVHDELETRRFNKKMKARDFEKAWCEEGKHE